MESGFGVVCNSIVTMRRQYQCSDPYIRELGNTSAAGVLKVTRSRDMKVRHN